MADNSINNAENTLQISELRYRRLFESARDGILLLNAETAQIEDVNPFLIELLGYTYDEFIGKKLWEIGSFSNTQLNMDAFAELQQNHYIRYEELPLQTKDGRSIAVEFVSNVYDCGGVDIIQCNIRDNTLRHLAEMAHKSAARSLNILSQSNFALINQDNEINLFTEYCRIAVETGGYLMAWVGLVVNDPDKSVVPIAHYGKEDGYLALAKITWAETERGNGAVGVAIRSKRVQLIEDIATDPAFFPWREEALKRGYHSTISLPFEYSDGIIACLTLYGDKNTTWSIAERMLLQEIAADLGFGVATFRTAIAKIENQEKLRKALEQTIQVIAGTIGERDSYTAGHQRRVATICSKIAFELGLSTDRIHGLHLAATIHDLGKISIPAEILAKPRRLSALEYGLIKEHSCIGYNLLKDVDFPWPIATIILQHHERIDAVVIRLD